MAVTSITYNNKVSVSTSTLPVENQVQASDMNEIKSVVNNNSGILGTTADQTDTNTTNIGTLQTQATNIPRYNGAITVPTTATWTASTVVEGYAYQTKILITGVTSFDAVQLFPDQATNDLGILSVENDSSAGAVTIYASEVPSVALNFTFALITKIN